MVLPAHAVQAVQVTLKAVTNEGTLLLRSKPFFVRISPGITEGGGGVTESLVLPAHALQAVQVTLKAVSNEAYFSLEAETVFLPYLRSHCSGVTRYLHMALTLHALQAMKVRLMSISNEGHFTLEDEKLFRPDLPSHCSEVRNMAHGIPCAYVTYTESRLKSVSNEDTAPASLSPYWAVQRHNRKFKI
jgi:hypothetical protein